jgi:hypothetical protein
MNSKLILGLVLAASAMTASATTTLSGTTDYSGATVGTSCDGQSESQQPVFTLVSGAVLKNVHLKAGGAADGIHCLGTCTLTNVTWDDVCEDAATMKGGSGTTMYVNGGAAYNAEDKVFQHNGLGSTVKIYNGFYGETIGKLYRSCGNCTNNTTSSARHAVIDSVKLNGVSVAVAGVNSNYGDTATITNLTIKGWTKGSPKVCVAYTGNNTGAEPTSLGEKWGTTNCVVTTSNITAY